MKMNFVRVACLINVVFIINCNVLNAKITIYNGCLLESTFTLTKKYIYFPDTKLCKIFVF